MDNAELERDRQIDVSALDVEAARQADRFFAWAERSIKAKSDVDRKEFQLKVKEAKLQLRAREAPEEFGIKGNATDTAIKSSVLAHKEYTDAVEDCNKAREEQALLQGAVAAMDMKKRMIEALITLHGQEYFAGPSTPRNLVAAWQEHQSTVGEKVNNRQGAVTRKRVRKDED